MKTIFSVLSLMAILCTAAVSADEPSNRTVVLQDNFDGRTSVGDAYSTARGMEDAWSVVDGVLIGKQTNDDHGAVIRTELAFDDIEIEFDFRFSGGSRFNFVIDDKNERSVHSGHICRVSISPKQLNVSDDKVGSMNLEVRKIRQNPAATDADKQTLQQVLAKTQSAVKVDLKRGQWHHLRVRIQGDQMQAFLDGKLATSLKSPGFAHATKSKFGFTVNGSTIDFDNLMAYRIDPSTTR
ncbi:hypothetical protein K227x_37780 [Rubripirellula lacrimiformis]|uniref:3-keto-alpha-glucoside-1,2-lyase/3-keto-2-hydroxy-glucal hydratase domain-containing protein n=1 Tax=Rubripirellula lacrimiformis TaxID=1930273 RepID=A0A517NE84_9BACT|nr:family 16 glycoside hydrolase [Rubripirellula lacrimiformis]QDT05378.1 hypothetical protein K227x_37780 [Rubripirellula lacrimiformis]